MFIMSDTNYTRQAVGAKKIISDPKFIVQEDEVLNTVEPVILVATTVAVTLRCRYPGFLNFSLRIFKPLHPSFYNLERLEIVRIIHNKPLEVDVE